MKQDQVVAFRADKALRDRIQAYAARLQEQAPGFRVAEADAVRDLVLRGLQAVETPSKKRR
jgi:hypothetical protein